jgi:type IV fimbrial biogenesis protein FimT
MQIGRKKPMLHPPRGKGFTVIELMIAVAIIGVLAALAIPSLTDFIEKNRLKGAAEEAQSLLQFARSEAVKRNADVFTRFAADGTTTWCFGTSTATNCDCTSSTSCAISIAGTAVVKRIVSTDFSNISLTTPANYELTFDHRRGMTSNNGTLSFTSPRGYEIRVVVNVLGRIRVCSPSGSNKVPGYEDC